jgi:hypothetical protein
MYKQQDLLLLVLAHSIRDPSIEHFLVGFVTAADRQAGDVTNLVIGWNVDRVSPEAKFAASLFTSKVKRVD